MTGGVGEDVRGRICSHFLLPDPLGHVSKLTVAVIIRPSGSCGTDESAAIKYRQISSPLFLYEIK